MTDRRLVDVSAELRQLIKTLSRKWDAHGRLTSKRAEIQSLLDLYRDVLIILDRITSEGMPAMAFMDEYMKRPPQRSDAFDLAAAQSFIARLAVDVKSLYHWTYAIEDFLAHSSVAGRVDLSELNRISIFWHKLSSSRAHSDGEGRSGCYVGPNMGTRHRELQTHDAPDSKGSECLAQSEYWCVARPPATNGSTQRVRAGFEGRGKSLGKDRSDLPALQRASSGREAVGSQPVVRNCRSAIGPAGSGVASPTRGTQGLQATLSTLTSVPPTPELIAFFTTPPQDRPGRDNPWRLAHS